jgi:hypothetical protein
MESPLSAVACGCNRILSRIALGVSEPESSSPFVHQRALRTMGSTMNDEVELPELVLLSDEPTPDHNADGLEMRAYAEVIAGAALGTRGPFTIGVLRQARSLTEKANPDAVCVWFNAWQYDHEAYPLVPLALEIAEAVDAKIQAAEERGTLSRWINWREIGTALRALASGLTIKAGIVEYDVSQIFTQIDRAVEADARLPLQPGVFQKAYAFLQQVTTVNVDGPEEERRPPVIVFVDDLDRCLPRHALRLLQAIRLVLNQPGFLFVLALDRDPVVHYLAREYEKLKMAEPDECARNYLDKMIQLPLWIPPHGGRFAGYLGALLDRDELKAHGEVKDALKQLMGLLQTGTEANPRAVVRLVNSLIADRCLWIARGNAVDAEWLGFCAISRVLRDRLGEDTYRTLVWSDRVCERLVQMKSPDELDERRREFAERGLEKLSRRESQEMKLLERIGQSAAVRALLETGIGQEWLRAHPSRREIEGYLAAERRATSAPESGGVMAIERAIRSELSLNDDAPITDVDRNGVENLNLRFTPTGE